MAFQVSPGVNVSEVDLTTVVPAVSTTEGAIAGVFEWGPVEQRVLVDSETSLVARFGEPKSSNFETFFIASNFLNYGTNFMLSEQFLMLQETLLVSYLEVVVTLLVY